MAVEIGALRAMLSLDSAAFERGAKRAEASMSNLQRRFSRVGRSLRSFGSTMSTRVTAPMVAGFGLMARSAFDSAFEIERMAQLSNAGLVEFQRFAAGAREVGIQQDKLSDILKDTNDRIGDFIATGGGPMADFFENIAPKVGVTAEQFQKLSGPEALQLYVSSLEKAGLSQQQMTFYMEALASDATALLPLLRNNGEEMDRLADSAENAGAVIKADTIEALNESRQALRAAGDAVKGLFQQLMGALAPAFDRIAKMVQGLATWFSGLSPRVKTITAAVVGFAAALGPLALVIGSVSSAIAVLMGAMKMALPAVVALGGPLAIIASVLGTAAAGMYLFGNKTEVATPHLDAAAEAQESLNAALGVFHDTAAPEAAAQAIDYANLMYQQAEASMAAAEAEIARAEAQQASLANSIDTARTQGLRQQADKRAAEGRKRLERATKALADAERARNRAAREITGGPMTLPSITFESDNAADTIRNLDDVANDVFGSGGSATSAVSEGANAIQNSLKGIGDSASGTADRFGRMVAGLITGSRKIGDVLSQLGEKLLSRSISGLASTIAPGLFGNSGLFAGLFDRGGMIPAGQFGIVGERGPEIVTGPAQVTSRRKTADMLSKDGDGAVTVNQTINISTGVQQTVRAEIKSLLPAISENAKSAVLDAKRRGGSYGGAF